MTGHPASTAEIDTVWFPSAIDPLVAVLLTIAPLATLATLVLMLLEKPDEAWTAAPALVFVAALYRLVVLPVRYGLAQEHLIVRFGLLRQSIPYAKIRSVRPSRSLLSSPALSLRRLRIDTGAGFWRTILISPAGRDAFLDSLAARAGLQRAGDQLWRE
jgi:hypothetical protein